MLQNIADELTAKTGSKHMMAFYTAEITNILLFIV
jgi:hypothetical protein